MSTLEQRSGRGSSKTNASQSAGRSEGFRVVLDLIWRYRPFSWKAFLTLRDMYCTVYQKSYATLCQIY